MAAPRATNGTWCLPLTRSIKDDFCSVEGPNASAVNLRTDRARTEGALGLNQAISVSIHADQWEWTATSNRDAETWRQTSGHQCRHA